MTFTVFMARPPGSGSRSQCDKPASTPSRRQVCLIGWPGSACRSAEPFAPTPLDALDGVERGFVIRFRRSRHVARTPLVGVEPWLVVSVARTFAPPRQARQAGWGRDL